MGNSKYPFILSQIKIPNKFTSGTQNHFQTHLKMKSVKTRIKKVFCFECKELRLYVNIYSLHQFVSNINPVRFYVT